LKQQKIGLKVIKIINQSTTTAITYEDRLNQIKKENIYIWNE